VSAEWGERESRAAERLIDLALAEDFGERGDITCRALMDAGQRGAVNVVSRQTGVLAGSPAAAMVFVRLNCDVQWDAHLSDGALLKRGDVIATVTGPLTALFSGERTALNLLTHLSGVATITQEFVNAVAGTPAAIFDTRKTHAGCRALEKYAVRIGGGRNHRMGLYDGILIKDNHLSALAAKSNGVSRSKSSGCVPADAVRRAVEFRGSDESIPVEIEVDTLDQLREALSASPDQILLDNMDVATLRDAVAMRDELAAQVQLEASGGITLETVRTIADTGVDRISVGALTHSARYVDIGFDWSL